MKTIVRFLSLSSPSSVLLSVTLVITFVLASRSFAWGQEFSADTIKSDKFTPEASGLVILAIAKNSQAEALGMKSGDVIVSYDKNDLKDPKALVGLIEKVQQEKAPETDVSVSVSRQGKVIDFTAKPGMLGLVSAPATKGTPVELRPADTGITLDYSKLSAKPIDDWYTFRFDENSKAGFEHVRMEKKGSNVEVTVKLAFDDLRWGKHYAIATAITTATPRPKLLETRMELPLENTIIVGKLIEAQGGKAKWETTTTKGQEKTVETIDAAADQLASYFATWFPGLVPAKDGSVLQYTFLDESTGKLGQPAAMVAVKMETITVEGKEYPAYRYEQRSLGQTSATSWVESSGRILKHDFRGATSVQTTKENALKDIPESLKEIAEKIAGKEKGSLAG